MALPDYLGAWNSGVDRGAQRGLAQLFGQAMQAPREERSGLIAKMAGTDPDSAIAAQKQFGEMDDDKRAQVARHAQLFATLPDEQKVQAYPQLAAEVGSLTGQQLPGAYDAKFLPMIQQVASWNSGGLTAEQQNFAAMTGQFTPEQIQEARMIQAGLKPRAGLLQVGEYAGGVYGVNRDPSKPYAVPVGVGQPSAQAAPQGADVMGNAFRGAMGPQGVQGVVQALAGQFGGQVTSLQRSQADNTRVGGVTNSQHLAGTAGDVVVPQQNKAAFIAAAQSQGLEAIDEGDHVHLELPPNRGGQLQAAPPKVSPAEEQRLGFDAERLRLQQNEEARKAADFQRQQELGGMTPQQAFKLQQSRKKEAGMLSSGEAKLDQTIKLVGDILAKRKDFGGITGMGALGARIPGTDWADLANKLETLKARSAFGSLQEMRANSPTGGALGSVTERELALLQNAETQLGNSQSPESLANALTEYLQVLRDSKRRLRQGFDEFYQDVPQEGQSTQGGGRRLKFNPATGRIE